MSSVNDILNLYWKSCTRSNFISQYISIYFSYLFLENIDQKLLIIIIIDVIIIENKLYNSENSNYMNIK